MNPNANSLNIETPSVLDLAEAGRILIDVDQETGLSDRIDRISQYFLGRPYAAGALGGGPDLPEILKASLEEFDCVTYLEVVMALTLAQTTNDFLDHLRRIRYRDGIVDWFHRNHYMVDWWRNNEQQGLIANLSSGPLTAEKSCTLDLIPGLPVRTMSFSYIPNQSVGAIVERVETGDLIFFVSSKSTLDVFHTGLLVKRDGGLHMRHATRTASAVIEQGLNEFLSKNQMAGITLLRPLCQQ